VATAPDRYREPLQALSTYTEQLISAYEAFVDEFGAQVRSLVSLLASGEPPEAPRVA
jgi:hypothetical protein